MKKLLSIILLIFVFAGTLSSCGQAPESTKEDALLGKWVGVADGDSIIYTFELNDDGEYTALCVIQHAGNNADTYSYNYSVTDTLITFVQGKNEKVCEYHFEDEYLFIDGLKYVVYEIDGNVESNRTSFTPINFVKNLTYMGSGLLGIFVVIGIIVTITYILNGVSKKK